jgi:hypothetical protein
LGEARQDGLDEMMHMCAIQGREYAVKAALRNKFGWVFEGQQVPPRLLIEDTASTPEIKISFVGGPAQRGEVIDLTPGADQSARNPYAGAQPDPTRTGLPSPPPREVTPTGAIYEHRNYEHKMPRAEEPPSIWDVPKRGDWMK